MRPVPRTKREYEKVDTTDWVLGVVVDIERDEKRDTKFKDEKTGEPIIRDSIRFKFLLDGYEYPHFSNWMSFSYHEKAGLMKKYLMSLVEGAQPDMDFDLENLKGMRIKMMWVDNGDFQNIETIRPVAMKLAKLPF